MFQFGFTLHFLLSIAKYLFICLTVICILFVCELSVHIEKHLKRQGLEKKEGRREQQGTLSFVRAQRT